MPEIKFEETNIAGIGSEEDKKLRELAARGETDFIGCGEAPGIKVFRIQKFDAVPVDPAEHGTFYDGDAYIILNTYTKDGSDALLHDLHFWLGKNATQDEVGAAAIMTVNLDDYLKGLPVQYREVQGNESDKFIKLFPSIKILQGGTDSGFKKAEGPKERITLYRVSGQGFKCVSEDVGLGVSVDEIIASGDVFVLETAKQIYHLSAPGCSAFEKAKAASVVQQLESESPFNAQGVVYETEEDIKNSGIAEYLTGGGSGLPPKTTELAAVEKALWKVSNEGASGLTYTKVDLSKDAVSDSDIMVLVVSNTAVLILVGSTSDQTEQYTVKAKMSEILAECGANPNSQVKICKPGDEAWDTAF